VFHPFHVVADQLRGEAAQSSGLRALRLRRYAENAARLERRAVEASTTTFAVCREDADHLATAGRPIVVAPNAVDLPPEARFGHRQADPVVLFPASLGYAPNADGAVWLGRQVWPLIRRAAPTARLLVVGRAPGPEVRALAGCDGIEVHGDVPDIAPWFRQARVVVVPLRFGTGTRIKALEAMAARRPVVGTTVGLAGLDLVDGLHAHVVDDAAGFAERVVDALGPAGDDLVDPARALVEARHTWPVVAATVLEALHTLTGGDL
jgi:glycosyltransferase involved in cell wall biosynthesis